ncbi:conserved hypothetical protein [Histoplasma capsulatum var. duboisii H88]|uniref:Uncharacterized protein n=1 Tax=Ajellomyces capsulatus (strain H88) TaxID=544711 RepID=F0UL61_AJEC8|nr:conserved hypothetical protein [Histoplasma capsulatum var. duboisii H88]
MSLVWALMIRRWYQRASVNVWTKCIPLSAERSVQRKKNPKSENSPRRCKILENIGKEAKLSLYHVKFHDAQHLTWLETLIFHPNHIQLESGPVPGAYLNAEARLLLQGRSKSTRRRWADETHDGPSTDMSKLSVIPLPGMPAQSSFGGPSMGINFYEDPFPWQQHQGSLNPISKYYGRAWLLCMRSKLRRSVSSRSRGIKGIQPNSLNPCLIFGGVNQVPLAEFWSCVKVMKIQNWNVPKFSSNNSSFWPQEGLHMNRKRVIVMGIGSAGLQIKGCKEIIALETSTGSVPRAFQNTANYLSRTSCETSWKGTLLDNHLKSVADSKKNSGIKAMLAFAGRRHASAKGTQERRNPAPIALPHASRRKQVSLEQGYYDVFNLLDIKIPLVEATPQGIKTTEKGVQADFLIIWG